jgi:hypothetical protein
MTDSMHLLPKRKGSVIMGFTGSIRSLGDFGLSPRLHLRPFSLWRRISGKRRFRSVYRTFWPLPCCCCWPRVKAPILQTIKGENYSNFYITSDCIFWYHLRTRCQHLIHWNQTRLFLFEQDSGANKVLRGQWEVNRRTTNHSRRPAMFIPFANASMHERKHYKTTIVFLLLAHHPSFLPSHVWF